MSFSNLLQISGNLSAVLVTLFIGIFIFIKNVHSKSNRWLALFNLSIALWCLGAFLINIIPSYSIALNIHRACYSFGVLLMPFFIYLVYSVRETEASQNIKLFINLATLCLLLFIPNPLFIKGLAIVEGTTLRQSSPGFVYYIFVVLFNIAVGYCLYMLFDMMKNTEGVKRNQAKFILIAYGIEAFGGVIYFLTIFKIWNIFTPAGWVVSLGVLILFYAIVKHQLMDVRLAITRWTIFLVVYGTLLLLPVIVVIIYRQFFQIVWGENWGVILFIIGIALAYVGYIIYHYLRDKAENRILREQYLYQRHIKDVSKNIIFIRDKISLKDFVEETLKSMNVKKLQFFEYDSPEKAYSIISMGSEKIAYSFNEDNELIELLKQKRGPFLCDETEEMSHYKEAINVIKDLHLVMLVPLFIHEQLLGFLSLGTKEDDRLYTKQDLELLENLASQAALAMENIRYEEELKSNKSKLLKQERLKGLGEMSAGFVHQINNPLGGVSMSSGRGEMITEKYSDDFTKTDKVEVSSEDMKKMKTEFKKIGGFVDQVDKIIRSITTFSKDSDFTKENIKDLIEVGIGLVPADKLEKNNIKIKKKIAENLPAIRAKAIDIEQIIMNLVTNAVDAIGEEGGEIIVEAKENPSKPDYIELKITDTGCGMPPEVLDKIFDIFYTTKGTSGTGLGLHLVYKMLKEHKAQIKVSSVETRGTTFMIYLPVFS